VPKSLKTLLELAPFVTAFAFVLSFLYLLAYWLGFGINVFEYLTISDVFIYSVPILLLLLISCAGGVSLGVVLDTTQIESLPSVTTQSPRGLRIRAFVFKRLWPMFAVVGFMIYLRNWLLIIGYLLFLILYASLVVSDVLSAHIPDRTARAVILLFLLAAPVSAVGFGVKLRDNITTGRVYKFVEATNMVDPSLFKPAEKLRYVGKAGDYFFLLREDGKSVIITRLNSFKSFELHDFAEKN
jgi:hypothetical protein